MLRIPSDILNIIKSDKIREYIYSFYEQYFIGNAIIKKKYIAIYFYNNNNKIVDSILSSSITFKDLIDLLNNNLDINEDNYTNKFIPHCISFLNEYINLNSLINSIFYKINIRKIDNENNKYILDLKFFIFDNDESFFIINSLRDNWIKDIDLNYQLDINQQSIDKLQFLRRYNLHNTLENTIISSNITPKSKIITTIDSSLFIYYLYRQKTYQLNSDSRFAIFNPNLIYLFPEFTDNTINLSHLIKLLGYTEKEILNYLKKISKKKLIINIIGLGGTMSNFIYWIKRLMILLNYKQYLFKSIQFFEDDKLELSNFLRIPLNWFNLVRKDDADNLFKLNLLKQDKFINSLAKNYWFNNFKFKKIYDTYTEYKNIFIGTPDLNTRNLISNSGCMFICPSHRNNTLSIWRNPKLDYELNIESYGSIKLPLFYLNMIKMTIEILKYLADGEYSNIEQNLLNFDIVKNNKFKEISAKDKELKNITYIFN